MRTSLSIVILSVAALSLIGCASLQQALGGSSSGAKKASASGSSSNDREAQLAAREQTRTTTKTGGSSEPRVTQSYKAEETASAEAKVAAAPEVEPEPTFEKNTQCEVTRDRTTYTKPVFKPGDSVRCYVKRGFNEKPAESLRGDVARYIELHYEGQLLHRHSFQDTFDGNEFWGFYIIPDPESEENKVFRKDWTGDFVLKLAELPPGQHNLEVHGYVQQGEVMLRAATTTVTYDNSEPHEVDFAKLAKKIDEERGRDPEAELNAWIEANGGADAWRAHSDATFAKREAAAAERRAANYYSVTLKNDCAKSLSVSTSNGKVFVIDSYKTANLEVMRGSSASINVGGSDVASVSESNEGGSVTLCR